MMRTVIALSLGLGWIVGGIEALKLGFSLPWHFSAAEAILLMLMALGSGGILGLLAGVLAGGVALTFYRHQHPTKGWTAGMTTTGLLLSAWLIVPLGLSVWNDERFGLAIGVWATILLFSFLVWQNADFWLRKSFVQGTGRIRWWWLSLVVGIVMSVTAAVSSLQKGYGSKRAIDTDPDVIVLSLDGVSTAAISSFAGDEALAQTPNVDALGSRCLRYDNAISPSDSVLSSHASMISGIYPGQTGVINDDSPFRFQFDTIPEVLAEEGYATAAFVSHSALSTANGFAQGFQLYDDDKSSQVQGIQQIQLIRWMMHLLDRRSTLRSPEQTLKRASNWLQQYSKTPALSWIQLQIPDGLTQAEYRQEVESLDREVGDFLRLLNRRDLPRKTLIVLTSAHGMHWREGTGSHSGIYDSVVHVPLIICTVRGKEKGVVSQQVRLLDVLNTVYWQVKLPHVKESQSADIVRFVEDQDFQGYQIFLIGRDPKSLSRGYTLGYRLKGKNTTNHYKYIWHSTRRQQGLYNVSKDPQEQEDISVRLAEMTNTLAQSTINASTVISGLSLEEADRDLDNISSIQE